MKVKSKRIILSLAILIVTLSAFPIDVSAQTSKQQLSPITINVQENSELRDAYPNAHAIGWRYKSENGKVYRRQYNYSRQKWIGEWELC
ncbi:hypothetical protein [Anaerocolumna sp.]|uniref:hypothetical protein n=1 Tax=Anaerocolumna sp. TaxID=2041569 RepID=UPI0028A99FC3|nr:hypothetical protein [Anaerocolumna sp.]